jgi:hypothetical protein
VSLSERLEVVAPRRSFRGCESCLWTAQLPKKDQESILEWAASGWSLRQLYDICITQPDDPLTISFSAFKNHLRDCHKLPALVRRGSSK